jgi:hypothetical protein
MDATAADAVRAACHFVYPGTFAKMSVIDIFAIVPMIPIVRKMNTGKTVSPTIGAVIFPQLPISH